MSDSSPAARWLVLAYQLPTCPSNAPVKTWRPADPGRRAGPQLSVRDCEHRSDARRFRMAAQRDSRDGRRRHRVRCRGHRGPQCTFETLCEGFGLVEPALARIAQIVHDLDMKETRFAPPEAPAVGRMVVDGLRSMYADDHALLEQGIAMFDALARSFEGDRSSR